MTDKSEKPENVEEMENKAEQAVETEETAKASDEVVEEIDEVEALKNQIKELEEQSLRLRADMQNMTRKHEADRQSLVKFGNEKLLSSFLPVMDMFYMAVSSLEDLKDHEDQKVKNTAIGVAMVRDLFAKAFEENNVEVINAVGKQFDPNFHEAMGEEACEGKENGEILREMQKGYILNGRVLRASKVIIVKN